MKPPILLLLLLVAPVGSSGCGRNPANVQSTLTAPPEFEACAPHEPGPEREVIAPDQFNRRLDQIDGSQEAPHRRQVPRSRPIAREWEPVAAKIRQLCQGQLPGDQIEQEVHQTIYLAQTGDFQPAFVMQMLQQGEAQAFQMQLSPVLVVTSCRQSLAFGLRYNQPQ